MTYETIDEFFRSDLFGGVPSIFQSPTESKFHTIANHLFHDFVLVGYMRSDTGSEGINECLIYWNKLYLRFRILNSKLKPWTFYLYHFPIRWLGENFGFLFPGNPLIEFVCFQLIELEFYVHHPDHPDPFSHTHPLQSQVGRWYLHPSGGTRKGLDFTFGQSEHQNAGVLIRGVMCVGRTKNLRENIEIGQQIRGPSRWLDILFSWWGVRTIQAFRTSLGPWVDAPWSSFDISTSEFPTKGLWMVPVHRWRDFLLRSGQTQRSVLRRCYIFF